MEDHSHPKTETLDASPGYCACHDEPASLEGDVNPCDVCDGIGFKTTKLSMGHPEELDTLAANKFKFEHLTLEQLKTMFHHYFNSSLPPTNEMFPGFMDFMKIILLSDHSFASTTTTATEVGVGQ